MLKPIKKKSVSDSVFEQLRDEIFSGAMEPGEVVPSERVLAEMLEVNRGAVREALKRLEQARLISIQHGEATRVLDFQKTAGTELLAELLMSPSGDLKPKVAIGVMELRSAIGTDIARRCAERSPGLGEELRQKAQEMADNKKDLEKLRELDMEFWSLMVDGSQNVAYRLVFNSIIDIYEKISGVMAQVVADELRDVEAHIAIADAVEEGRVDDAEFYARDLIKRGEETVRKIADRIGEK